MSPYILSSRSTVVYCAIFSKLNKYVYMNHTYLKFPEGAIMTRALHTSYWKLPTDSSPVAQ